MPTTQASCSGRLEYLCCLLVAGVVKQTTRLPVQATHTTIKAWHTCRRQTQLAPTPYGHVSCANSHRQHVQPGGLVNSCRTPTIESRGYALPAARHLWPTTTYGTPTNTATTSNSHSGPHKRVCCSVSHWPVLVYYFKLVCHVRELSAFLVQVKG
jgi:hypothetical protein